MNSNFREWDIVEYLKTEEDIAAYINAAIEEGDPAFLQVALGDVARARGMTEIAREAGVGRESLYKSLSITGNPSFKTIEKVLKVLGLKLQVIPDKPKHAHAV